MKRLLLNILLMFIFVFGLQAQVDFGARIGLGWNTAKDSYVKVGYLCEPSLGLMVSTSLSENFDLQAELNYTMRGFTDKIFTEENNKMNCTCHLNYLEIPVLVKFYPLARLGLNLQLGPQIGYMIHNSINLKMLDGETVSLSDIKRIDYGINFGAGLRHGVWNCDIRYYLGLSSVCKYFGDNKNRGIMVSVGYFFM